MADPIAFPRVLVVGGAGYVGSALVPFLAERGTDVTVVDLCLYGERVFEGAAGSERIRTIKGDIRDRSVIARALEGQDAVVHLACISNDPSFELDPALGRSINYDAFLLLLDAVRASGARRLVYASSSSVYGVREQPDVREDSPKEPLTDYSRYKLKCEEALAETDLGGCEWVVVRPATVCGWAPRLRLDLTVNILTIHALVKREITVHGGKQLRPNINIRDMVEVYRLLLESPSGKVRGETFNAGYENRPVGELAALVKEEVGDAGVAIKVEPTVDHRSYHINSDKIAATLDFRPRHTIREAIGSLCDAYRSGRIPDPLGDPRYYNVKTMQLVGLK